MDGRGLVKSQDIFLLLKLLSLELPRAQAEGGDLALVLGPDAYSVRGLAESTGVSKSEVANAFKRCTDVGLLKTDRYSGLPVINRAGLLEFLVHGLRYVFPASLGGLTRGMPTGVGAPVMAGKLLSAGELLPVWADAEGGHMGLAVEPLFKTVPMSARRDRMLYDLLALTDALRLGRPREHAVAAQMLADKMAASA